MMISKHFKDDWLKLESLFPSMFWVTLEIGSMVGSNKNRQKLDSGFKDFLGGFDVLAQISWGVVIHDFPILTCAANLVP